MPLSPAMVTHTWPDLPCRSSSTTPSCSRSGRQREFRSCSPACPSSAAPCSRWRYKTASLTPSGRSSCYGSSSPMPSTTFATSTAAASVSRRTRAGRRPRATRTAAARRGVSARAAAVSTASTPASTRRAASTSATKTSTSTGGADHAPCPMTAASSSLGRLASSGSRTTP